MIVTMQPAGTGKEANHHEIDKSDRGRHDRVRHVWL